MDGDCGSISMDRYWNTIGTPFFFIVLGFGLFVLFTMNNIQFASNQHIFNVVAGVLQGGPPSKSKKSAAKAPAEEAAPAPRGNKNTAAPAPAPNAAKAAAANAAAANAAAAAAANAAVAAAAAGKGAKAEQLNANTSLNSAEKGTFSQV